MTSSPVLSKKKFTSSAVLLNLVGMASGSLPPISRLGLLDASSLSEALGEEGLGAGTQHLLRGAMSVSQ